MRRWLLQSLRIRCWHVVPLKLLPKHLPLLAPHSQPRIEHHGPKRPPGKLPQHGHDHNWADRPLSTGCFGRRDFHSSILLLDPHGQEYSKSAESFVLHRITVLILCALWHPSRNRLALPSYLLRHNLPFRHFAH